MLRQKLFILKIWDQMESLLGVLEILKIFILSMMVDNLILALKLMISRASLRKTWCKLINDMRC
jgi:hypothetical protein